MSFVLFPALLLLLQKAPVFLGLSCLAAYALTQFLVLLMLKLERLLCLCADPARFELTFDFPLQPLRIQPPLGKRAALEFWTKAEAVPVSQQKLVNLIILWLRAEGDLAHLICAV